MASTHFRNGLALVRARQDTGNDRLKQLVDLQGNNEQWFVNLLDVLERLNDQAGLVTGLPLGKNERIE